MAKLIIIDARRTIPWGRADLDTMLPGTVFTCEGLAGPDGVYLKTHAGVVNLANPDQTWTGSLLGVVFGFCELEGTLSIKELGGYGTSRV